MLPGEYDFGTKDKEIMEILQGDLDVLLPGEDEWKHFTAGDSFEVAPDSSFKLRVHSVTDYCCSYIAK